MSGVYRLILAVYVLLFHLSGAFPFAGQLAVYSFYTLSGYLITLVLLTTYKNRLGAFAVNRTLRIYPTYWICLAASAFIVWFYGGVAQEFMPRLYLPTDLALIQNIFVFGLLENDVRLLPPAWSLNIELVWYILMGLGLSRWRWGVIIWFLISTVLVLSIMDQPWTEAYFSFVYPSIAFSTGALVYHFRQRLTPSSKGIALAGLTLGCIFPAVPQLATMLGTDQFMGLSSMAMLHLSPFVTTLAILGFRRLEADKERSKLSQITGDMSYPLFLMHWPLATIVSLTLLGSPDLSFKLALVTLVLCLAFSVVVVLTFEPLFKQVRRRIRHGYTS